MRVDQLGEFRKDFHNLVGAFTTGGDDYDIGFRLFGDSVLEHCLTRTERAGDKSCTTLHNRIDGIDYAHTRFQQFERTRLLFIVRHGALHGPFLNHIHFYIVTFFVGQDSNSILNAVVAFLYDGLHGTYAFLPERNHDFQRLEVFIHLPQPCSGFHLVAHLCQRHKMPFAFLIQRIRILSALQENAIHFIEVVLQTVIVFRKHTGTQCHFEHVSGKLSFGSHLQSTGAFKHLYIDLSAYHFNNLRHQSVSAGRDITNLVLCHGAVNYEGHHIGYYATNSSFCCHIIM